MLEKLITIIAVIAGLLAIPGTRVGKAVPVPVGADPSPTAAPTATPQLEQTAGVERLEAQAIPAGCEVPPPWSDWATALACHSYYPAPRSEPLPGCRLDYTVQGNLLAWGYIVFPDVTYCPTVANTPQPPASPTPHGGYP
jgi:hypothetical protein